MNLVYPESPTTFLRRSFFGVLLFMFLYLFIAVVPVQASGVKVSLDEMTVDPAGTAVVTARVEGLEAPGLVGYDFKINYLPSVVNLIALTKTNDFAKPTPLFNITDPNPSKVPGEILVVSAQSEGKTGDIALFTLTFKAVGTAGQSSPITLTVKDLAQNYYTANGVFHEISDIIDPTISNGKITIGSNQPQIPTVTSTIGTVSIGGTVNETINGVPTGTTLATLRAAITPSTGATFEIYQADGTTLANSLADGYKVVVIAQDGISKTVYTVHFAGNTTLHEYGNLNGDHLTSGAPKITSDDALIALKIAARLVTPTDEQAICANVNGDLTATSKPKITSDDALLILKKAARLITKFPVEP